MTECKSYFSCLECSEGPDHEAFKTSAARSSRSHNDTTVRAKATDELLAAQMRQLTVEERGEALDDVHCVGEELKETPEIIQKSLAELGVAIEQEKNTTYDIAMKQNRAYVEDPVFRLKFLRANLHDVNKAVRQMMSFLEKKAVHFGIEKVAREITLDDLTDEDRKFMLMGIYHIQDARDRTGRVVLYSFNGQLGKASLDCLIRIMYYIFYNILIPMPEVQMKGVNAIYYDVAKLGEDVEMPGPIFLKAIIDMLMSLPFRASTAHHCLKKSWGNLLLNDFILETVLKATPMYSQVRSRIHLGSDMEVQYQLQSHGIPIRHCPVDGNGNFRVDILNAWFYKHLSQQSPSQYPSLQAAPIQAVCDAESHKPQQIVPQPHDILLGRGKMLQTHLGNVCFRQFVKQYSEEYDETPRCHRRLVLIKVVQDLKHRGIRFLRQVEDTDEWIESDVADMEKTVGQVFRNLRKQQRSGS
ncbi:MAG: hypothetical protein SGBAC_012518 [Bacillariaceae sp.]